MTIRQVITKNKGLIAAFKNYKKRYLDVGKKPDFSKLFPEILFRTMRLEGEKTTRKRAQSLFK